MFEQTKDTLNNIQVNWKWNDRDNPTVVHFNDVQPNMSTSRFCGTENKAGSLDLLTQETGGFLDIQLTNHVSSL